MSKKQTLTTCNPRLAPSIVTLTSGKTNKVLTHAIPWMSLKNIMLSEKMPDTNGHILYVPFICSIHNRKTHKYRTHISSCQEEGGTRVIACRHKASLEKMEKFWNYIGVMITQHCEYTKIRLSFSTKISWNCQEKKLPNQNEVRAISMEI